MNRDDPYAEATTQEFTHDLRVQDTENLYRGMMGTYSGRAFLHNFMEYAGVYSLSYDQLQRGATGHGPICARSGVDTRTRNVYTDAH
jgi:hypothetical protein